MARNTVIALKGERYGRLTVVESVAYKKGGHKYHLCVCDCGAEKHFTNSNLVKGKSKSCGCLAKEATSKAKKSHGLSGTRIYRTWNMMRQRCSNPTVDRYPQYGGRGISVCDRWKSFESFYEDMGDIPSPKHSIGRIDNNGNYEPSNCRWETPEEQGSNTSRTLLIEHDGVTKSLSQWAGELGADYSKLIQRYNSGMRPPMLFDRANENLRDVPITIDGKTKLTTEWMQLAGIPISSFYYHLRKGLSKEAVVEKYLAKIV